MQLLTQFYIHCRKVQYAQIYINLNKITFFFHNLGSLKEAWILLSFGSYLINSVVFFVVEKKSQNFDHFKL